MEVIAEAVACKQGGRARRVVVAGCLVNREGEALYDLAPGIDAVVGVNDRDGILSAVTGRGRVSRVSACSGGTGSDAGRFRLFDGDPFRFDRYGDLHAQAYTIEAIIFPRKANP